MVLFSLLFACSSSSLLAGDASAAAVGAEAGRASYALVISEVASRPGGAKFVEICNRSDGPVSLGATQLRRFANGNSWHDRYYLPDVELPAGQAFVVTYANATRLNYPFGEVVDVEWAVDGSQMGLDAWGNRVFEPPTEVKGNIARALLYMRATYAFDMHPYYKARMQRWSAEDPVDADERLRNERIAAEQGSGNALIECPSWVDRF